MGILESLSRIPPMFYLAALLLPAAVFGYSTVSKPKKTVAAKFADPAEQLKIKKIDARRETRAAGFLGLSIACGLALLISIGQIIGDYKNDQGLFAVELPALSFPPAPDTVLPPAPPAVSD
jgi:hypothetical protein